jgi:hypothetical protein
MPLFARLSPWLCLLAIPLLFELPAVLTSTALDPGALRLSLDLPLLLTIWLASLGLARTAPVRVALRVLATLLALYRLDQWVCWTLLRDEPLLYDQFFMLRHLWALIGDLMSVRTVLVLVTVGAILVGMGFLLRALSRRVRPLALGAARRRTLGVLALIWCVLLAFRTAALSSEDPAITWLLPTIVTNIRRSTHTYGAIRKRLGRSPYAAYDKLALRDKPDVLLFVVESYGRLLSVEEKTAAQHAALLDELEAQFKSAGFHAVSAFATATVSGGRSWIAEGNILMGTPIRYEAVFQHLVSQRPPNLVGFLNHNGYESALLAPADRDRAGFRAENRYAFTRLFGYDQLHYPGPAIGWGLIPDQYSLAFVEKNFLAHATRPVFLDFHMVSSHAPWSEVPKLVDSTEQLFEASAQKVELGREHGPKAVRSALRRYARSSGRFAYMHRFDDAMRAGYQATVEYDLRLIAQYVARRERDGFIIVLGDHQPPVIAREDKSFDAPVHVLSRDPARLAPLLKHGFSPGLKLAPNAPPALEQAGLFSLWVHSLLAKDCAGCALPEVLPHGNVLVP